MLGIDTTGLLRLAARFCGGAACLILLPALAIAQPTTTILAAENQPAPDGTGGTDGSYAFFINEMVTRDSGIVVFPAQLTDSRRGIFWTDGTTTRRVVIEGQSAPGQDGLPVGSFTSFYENLSVNESGQVAFKSSARSESGLSIGNGIWRLDGADLTHIILKGDSLDAFGTVENVGVPTQINASGAMVLEPEIATADGPRHPLLLADGESFRLIALIGDHPVLNDAGHVAFTGPAEEGPGGLYLYDGSNLSFVVRREEIVPDIGEIGPNLRHHDLNERGEVSFWASIVDAPNTVFRGSKNGLVAIARVGDPAPDASGFPDGVIQRFDLSQILINDEGEVLFRATISDAPSGSTTGLFIGDGTELLAVVREGDPSPDGDGFIDRLGAFYLPGRTSDTGFSFNKWGHVAFDAELAGTTDGGQAMFLWEKTAGLTLVARQPDPLGTGARGLAYTFLGASPWFDIYQDAFNQASQITILQRSEPEVLALWEPGDIFPPTVSQLRTFPESPLPNIPVRILANADDADSGGALIQSAEYRVDGGAWQQMSATDGAFDETGEEVEAEFTSSLSGEHEVCVRATDAVGYVSSPDCIRVVVDTDNSVGLMVRCLHSPLYPQDGEMVTVRAQSLDRHGRPAVADEVKIYIDDRDEPAFEAVGTDEEVMTEIAADRHQLTYGCWARRGTELAFSGYVGVDVGTPQNPHLAAIPVLYHGRESEKIDLLFFPEFDAYPDGPFSADFQNDLHRVIREGLFEIPWFVRNQSVLNVWIATEGAGVEPLNPDKDPDKPLSRCKREKPEDYGKKYGFSDGPGIIHKEKCRDVAIPGSPFTTRYREHALQVVAHEIGHKAFSLADEYTGATTIRFSAPPFPNLFATLQECVAAAVRRGKDPLECRLLPGGPLNLNGQWIFEPDYSLVNDPALEIRDLMQQTGVGICSFDDTKRCNRYRIGDSEEDRFSWKLSRCDDGGC